MFDENTGIGFGTYIFFGFWCGLSAIWAFFLVPEVSIDHSIVVQSVKLTHMFLQTMGKSLEQIDHAFGDFTGREEREVMAEVMGRVHAGEKQLDA